MKLLPKSPLDISPLRRGTGRGRCYFAVSDQNTKLFCEKEKREEERQRERETDAFAYAKKR